MFPNLKLMLKKEACYQCYFSGSLTFETIYVNAEEWNPLEEIEEKPFCAASMTDFVQDDMQKFSKLDFERQFSTIGGIPLPVWKSFKRTCRIMENHNVVVTIARNYIFLYLYKLNHEGIIDLMEAIRGEVKFGQFWWRYHSMRRSLDVFQVACHRMIRNVSNAGGWDKLQKPKTA